jgi:fermentation-respiration switch protein FrsA (DUF1100 family)
LSLGFGFGVSLAAGPDVYDKRTEPIPLGGHPLTLHLVTPKAPRSPALLVLFATGDAGWFGASGEIFDHMAERGLYVAAFDSREVVKPVERSGRRVEIAEAAAAVDTILVASRRALKLPETTPVIVTGFSRGANLVVFTAGVESLRHHLAGGVAVALTRETDFLRAPDPEQRPGNVQVDAKGRMQTYPAIERAGSIPFAVIQSTGDRYVPAAESRRLFGPDTPTRRLYEVDARNHGFSGGRDELLRDLDDALAWIEGIAARR